ncbi:hypothetical protein [Actinomadura sp. 21ATH]|uniref:hypothetical protein n=1 Tax=Actinomadura sp. 21ATH TaxID=1735444 RepID=UPI0035C0B2C5
MDPSFPLVPGGTHAPEPRPAGNLARPGGAAAPLHRAEAMRFGGRPRQEYWEAIGPRTRQRLHELAGGVIDWFAAADASAADGRPYGVVFGDRGLAIAEPRIDTAHRPVYAISAFVLDPGSLRHVAIDHRPPPGPAPFAPAGTAGAAGPDIGLSPAAKGVLGNLPPRAQELLQTPFTQGRRLLCHDWWYEGAEHRLSAFILFLAGAKDVTVAVGTKDVPVGHTDATAHWSLTCYRASVQRRIGK